MKVEEIKRGACAFIKAKGIQGEVCDNTRDCTCVYERGRESICKRSCLFFTNCTQYEIEYTKQSSENHLS